MLPVLHDVVTEPVAGLAPDRSEPPLAARLDAAYRTWATETTPVAEGPIARVLALVLDGAEGFTTP